MELHQAFKYVIGAEGNTILNELRLVNILNDLNAYQDIQGSKYIVRALIDEGYGKRFLQCGSLNQQASDIINKFHALTGFNRDNVELVFYSLAFGLGWINAMPKASSSPTSNQPPVPTPPSPSCPPTPNKQDLNLTTSELENKSGAFLRRYKEQAESYLDNIIHIDGNPRKELGVDLNASSCYEPDSGYFSINFEIKGNFTVTLEFWMDIKAAIYDINGRVIKVIDAEIDKNALKKTFMIRETNCAYETDYKFISNISKIVVFWDFDC